MKTRFLTLMAGALSASLAVPAFAAKELKSGEFTVVKNQVEHSLGSSKSLAKTKDQLEEKSVVDTGAASLTELGFNDSSVLRLGSNTQFSFQSKERIIKLDKGTMLMNVPTGNGGITVDGGGVTGAVSGTTVMASRDEEGNFSFMILEGEGSGKVIGKDGVAVDLIPGQMAIVRQDGKPTKVVEVNVDAMRDYSPLYTDFSARLPGTDGVQGTTDRQANDVQNEILFLQRPQDQGLEDSGPGVRALAMLAGMSSTEMDNSRNILLGDSTAAGLEALSDSASSASSSSQAAIGSLSGLSGASSGTASPGAVLAGLTSAIQEAANSGDDKSLQALTFAAITAVGKGSPEAVQSVVSGIISSIASTSQASEAAAVISAAALVTASNFGDAAAQAASLGATTAAASSGNAALAQAVSQGLANGQAAVVQGIIVASGTEGSGPNDARQTTAEPLIASSTPPSSGDGGGLGGTDTAAGTEGGGGGEGDLGATETAAGGGGTPDTQAPISPVNVPTTPGLTTPI